MDNVTAGDTASWVSTLVASGLTALAAFDVGLLAVGAAGFDAPLLVLAELELRNLRDRDAERLDGSVGLLSLAALSVSRGWSRDDR